MFLVELVAFLVVWPIMWWLGGRLAEDGLPADPTRRPHERLPDNVIDLEQFRRRHRARRPAGRR